MTDEPGTARNGDRPVGALVEFAGHLRGAGLSVGADQVVTFCRAVEHLGLGDLEDIYWSGRACLVTGGDQIPTFDTVFDAVFRGARRYPTVTAAPDAGPVLSAADQSDDQEGTGDNETELLLLRASATERLRDKDFSALSSAERRAIEAAIAQLRVTPPLRRSRRTIPARRGWRPDVRRSIRRSMRTHGEIVTRVWRGPRTKPRRLVLLLDISGSMADYSRWLLFFAHALSRAEAKVEVFCFGTRITRVTRPLRSRDPDAALANAAAEVLDWDGGTRIGDSIIEFLREWGRPGMARNSLVLICSDGLERGEPAQLAEAMQRLSRLAHSVVWVNPLKGDAQYQPLARGMSAALPHIDHFLPGHNLTSLEDLSRILRDIA
jgi:uncharacterized protein with von Willebrand factor type A (vWA) domain